MTSLLVIALLTVLTARVVGQDMAVRQRRSTVLTSLKFDCDDGAYSYQFNDHVRTLPKSMLNVIFPARTPSRANAMVVDVSHHRVSKLSLQAAAYEYPVLSLSSKHQCRYRSTKLLQPLLQNPAQGLVDTDAPSRSLLEPWLADGTQIRLLHLDLSTDHLTLLQSVRGLLQSGRIDHVVVQVAKDDALTLELLMDELASIGYRTRRGSRTRIGDDYLWFQVGNH